VLSLDEVGGSYRVHARNNHHQGGLDLEQTRRIIHLTGETHRYLLQRAEQLGLPGRPATPTDLRSVTNLAHRLISLKLEPEHHPLEEDTLRSLFRAGIQAALQRRDAPARKRALYLLWFAMMTPAPKSLARWLATRFFHPT
jgi:hypothetical protein